MKLVWSDTPGPCALCSRTSTRRITTTTGDRLPVSARACSTHADEVHLRLQALTIGDIVASFPRRKRPTAAKRFLRGASETSPLRALARALDEAS